MNHANLQETLESMIPGLAAAAEVSMAADDADRVSQVNSEVVACERVLQDAASALMNIRSRIINCQTSGDPNQIIRGQNDL